MDFAIAVMFLVLPAANVFGFACGKNWAMKHQCLLV
jgi:hypothetical protein